VEEHIPESELLLFAFDPNAVRQDRQRAIVEHVEQCAECRADLDFYAVAEQDLSDPDVWEPVAGSSTLDTLRAYAARIAAEDEEADELLAPLFSSPDTDVWRHIGNRQRFVTGGVVRRLSAHAHGICESEPLDALTFADAAISVAESLADDRYPGLAVFELRGTAWKERANAQLHLGRFSGALESLTHAERAYRRLTSPALGLATVALVRASVFYQQQRLEEAAAMAEEAERGFAHLGENERRVRAIYLRGGIRYEAQDLQGAMALFRQVIAYGEEVHDPMWIARASYALGNCEVDAGDLAEASMHFHTALAIFRELGPATERICTEWGIARVFLQNGKINEGIGRLRDVEAEFESRGMVTDAALAALDVAEALLAIGQSKQLVDLATRLFRVFTEAEMVTGALTAMAYIKDAAADARLTPEGIDTVRKFLRRSERQPELLFRPPQNPS
jgi:tetratricopeptide (TPR) repeat protein